MKKILIMMFIASLGVISCKKESCENPFYCDWDTPFEVPPFDKIKIEHFKPAFLKSMGAASMYIKVGINDYKYTTASRDYRENSIVTGIKCEF